MREDFQVTVRLWAALLGLWCPLWMATAMGDTIDDLGVWTAIFSQGELGGHEDQDHACKWWFDGHLRFFDDVGGFGQSIVRPGVGYELSENVTAWAGYGWIVTSPASGDSINEHRPWQQLTWSHTVEPGKIDFRSRLEQRFVETGSDLGWRFRQLVAYRRPFHHDPRLTLVTWDEIFFHLNDTDWGARAGFDQNRAFFGFGWKPHSDSDWRVETGYLHQFVDRTLQDELSNHLLSINLFWNP